MKNNKNNAELQSRREFFKNAAKSALPILGAIVLANMPMITSAAETSSTSCSGCNNRCMNSCFNTCHGKCDRHCSDNCSSNCRGTCSSSCGRGSKY
ncbi:MAG: Cys-Xaa-Xaa-Xaa repeat radical SAM target protein [Bacteroidaceae bacterium]|nr:Cys-Xaa-Xaa-Xaa repeat radical SAM target protein [Bacteroidaceae bacterium]